MATTTTGTGTDLDLVTAALAGMEPPPGRVLLFGSRARGEARPDSDIDLLVVAPQASLTALERQQALRSLRAVLRPLPLSVSVDLVVVVGGGGRGCPQAGRIPSACAPAEDALLLLRLVERHLGRLQDTLDPLVFADEDWGFLAQQTLEKLL